MALMDTRVLDNYGVVMVRARGGMKYVLPWRRHERRKGAGVKVFCFGVLPMVAAGALPWGALWLFGEQGGVFRFLIWGWAVFWWGLCLFFVGIFGAMGYSEMTGWGRGWIWMNRGRVFALQLSGEESGIAYVETAGVKEFAALPEEGDRGNPATSARLLAMRENNVSRVLRDYPVEMVDALVVELNVRLKEMLGRK